MAGLGLAPVILAISFPLLNSINVGIEEIEFPSVILEFSSLFNFAVIKADSYSAEISSNIGASMRHGPHHSAQKSTSTGRSFSNKESNVAVVASINSYVLLE